MATATKKRTAKHSNDQIRRDRFVKELAQWLGGPNQVRMSIGLQAGKVDAEHWSRIRGATPLFGYPSAAEAEQVLREFLNIPALT